MENGIVGPTRMLKLRVGILVAARNAISMRREKQRFGQKPRDPDQQPFVLRRMFPIVKVWLHVPCLAWSMYAGTSRNEGILQVLVGLGTYATGDSAEGARCDMRDVDTRITTI
jgi:hypothetical protein